MDTVLNRNFKVKGNIACIYKPAAITETLEIANVEVQLWHKAPMQVIFLGKSLTNSDGDFIIEFEVDSPVDYIVDGKISDVFIRAFYNGEELFADDINLLKGLVAYWKLDEITGSDANDATGNGHTGTLSGATLPNWAAGKINNGLYINGAADGSGDSYLSIPTSSDFDFEAGDFTIAFWMQPNNTSNYFCPIDSGYGTPTGILLEFGITNLNLYCESSVIYTKPFIIDVGVWYHVVVRRIADQLEICINNTTLGAESFTGLIACPASELLLGKYSADSETLDGVLDEIGIWKGHGLSDTEIATLYNEGNGLQYPFT